MKTAKELTSDRTKRITTIVDLTMSQGAPDAVRVRAVITALVCELSELEERVQRLEGAR